MAHKCKKCGNENNYNFAINNGMCNSCIEEKLEALEDLRERGRIYKAKVEEILDGSETHKLVKVNVELSYEYRQVADDFEQALKGE